MKKDKMDSKLLKKGQLGQKLLTLK